MVSEAVFVQTAVPADAWREWASGAEFQGALGRRIEALDVPRRNADALRARAIEDSSWRSVAALDAAVRASTSLTKAGGLARGREAERGLEAFVARATSEVEEEYSRNPMQFGQPEMLHASHIVKHTNDGTPKEDAHKVILQAKKQLEEGAEFDVLCRQFSDCKGQSGDLGWFPRGQMVQGFEDVIFKMKPDEISDIFETEFGYHIAKLHEKKPATVTPFDQVKDTLKTQLWEQRRHDTIETLVGELRGKAKIEQ